MYEVLLKNAINTNLAIEDDWARGSGVLEHGNNLVKVSFLGGLFLVHGDADWLKLGDLILDSGIDLIQGGDASQLLGQFFIGSSLLRVLSKLNKMTR